MNFDNNRDFFSDFILQNTLKPVYKVDFIQAAAWLLPIESIKKIGQFDELFFHYGEDDNYCQRVKFFNKRIGVLTNAFVRHDSNKPLNESPKLFSKKYFDE